MYKNILEQLNQHKLINNGKVNPSLSKKITSELSDLIIRHTSFLDYDAPISDRIKIMQLGYEAQPKCVCGNGRIYYRSLKDFTKHCSKKCSDSDPVKIKAAQESYDLVRERSKERRKATNLERFGCESSLSSPQIRERIKITNLEKYGHENIFGSEFGKQRIKEFNLENFGVEYSTQVEKNNKKRLETFQTRFGGNAPVCDVNIKRKIFTTRNGYFAEEYNLSDKVDYKRAVTIETRKWDVSLLEHNEKRGRVDLLEDAYHLDHIIPMEYGFANKIPPEHIGHICNLRFIPAKENMLKSAKLIMKYEELLEMIQLYESL